MAKKICIFAAFLLVAAAVWGGYILLRTNDGGGRSNCVFVKN